MTHTKMIYFSEIPPPGYVVSLVLTVIFVFVYS